MRTYTDPDTLTNPARMLGVVRRLRALAWMGHDPTVVAVKYHTDPLLLRELCNAHTRRSPLKRRFERDEFPLDVWYAVATAYQDLGMTFGPSDYYRARARAENWMPPLAWDDDTLDDPRRGSNKRGGGPVGGQPADHAVVWRRINGDHEVPMRTADRIEAVRILHDRGLGTYAIADALGIYIKQVERDRAELGLEARGTPAGYMNRSHDPALFSRAKGLEHKRAAGRVSTDLDPAA